MKTLFEGSEYECKELCPNKKKELGGIIHLKGNKIPKGVVSLEWLFDRHDGYCRRLKLSFN